MCEICSNLTIKSPQGRFTVFIVNFEHISYLFTPFFSVSIADFEQVNICWVPPYQFTKVEITYCCNYKQMYKNLSKMAVHKKDCDPKQSFLKTFFHCSLLCLIDFTEYSVSLFHKISSGYPLLNGYCIYFRTTLATMNCVYTMYLTDIPIKNVLLFQRGTCSHTFEWYRHYFRRQLVVIQCFQGYCLSLKKALVIVSVFKDIELICLQLQPSIRQMIFFLL